MEFWYLATPYTKYPGGMDAAHMEAVKAKGLLMQAKIRVFSPIVHTHVVSVHCNIPGASGESIWSWDDEPYLMLARGIIVLMAGYNWRQSEGIAHEVSRADGRPLVYMHPGVVPACFVDGVYAPDETT